MRRGRSLEGLRILALVTTEAAAAAMPATLTVSTAVMTAVVTVHGLVIAAITPVFAIIAVVAIVTVPSAVVVMVALAGQVTAFLEFREGRHFLGTDREEDAAEEDSFHAMHGREYVIVQQHAFFEHQMGNAFAPRVHHHEA